MFGILKSPMMVQLERQGSRLIMSGLRNQSRTLVVVGQKKDKKRGNQRIFIPRSIMGSKSLNEDRKPSTEVAHDLPLSYQEMDNATLVTLGNLGMHQACKEMLKRHIMDVDSCDYDAASRKFKEISKKNLQGAWILNIPYKVGIGLALCAAVGSFPMVFDLGTATWFNKYYVTTDVPEPRDLETALEVGSWTWNVRSVYFVCGRLFGLCLGWHNLSTPAFCITIQLVVDGAPSRSDLFFPLVPSICK